MILVKQCLMALSTLQAAISEDAGEAAKVSKSKEGRSLKKRLKKQAEAKASQPGSSGVSTDSALHLHDIQPGATQSQTQPVSGESESQQVNCEGGTQPVTDESMTQPMHGELETQPAAVESETWPAADESEAEPVTGKAETQPIAGESETQSVYGEGNTQPVASDIGTQGGPSQSKGKLSGVHMSQCMLCISVCVRVLSSACNMVVFTSICRTFTCILHLMHIAPAAFTAISKLHFCQNTLAAAFSRPFLVHCCLAFHMSMSSH